MSAQKRDRDRNRGRDRSRDRHTHRNDHHSNRERDRDQDDDREASRDSPIVDSVHPGVVVEIVARRALIKLDDFRVGGLVPECNFPRDGKPPFERLF